MRFYFCCLRFGSFPFLQVQQPKCEKKIKEKKNTNFCLCLCCRLTHFGIFLYLKQQATSFVFPRKQESSERSHSQTRSSSVYVISSLSLLSLSSQATDFTRPKNLVTPAKPPNKTRNTPKKKRKKEKPTWLSSFSSSL